MLPWSGQPAEPPALAVANRRPPPGRSASRHGWRPTVYASWNGATEVASWRVLAGSSAAALAPVASAPKDGFETAIALPASAGGSYVAVQALNAAGAVIGVSAATNG